MWGVTTALSVDPCWGGSVGNVVKSDQCPYVDLILKTVGSYDGEGVKRREDGWSTKAQVLK